ncbi:MAG: PEP/pyruvate-binding domain-containing protein [Pseudomonadota bacterium]
MSNKYSTLRALAALLPVPALICIDERDFPQLWSNYGHVRDKIDNIFTTINLTAAAFLDRHLIELEQIEPLAWQPGADALLADRLREAGLAFEMALAVRSSSHVEDAQGHSFAGLFATFLNVRGLDEVKQAITRVWLSNCSRATLLERLRLGLLSSPGAMTVILQTMVEAQWAGVAFSHDPVTGEDSVLIEATAGLGEQLVSGSDAGAQARIRDGLLEADPELAAHHAMLHQVNELMTVAARHLGGPTDIEWAHDGRQVWLLQARPITSVARAAAHGGPVCEFVDLYVSADASLEQYKPLPDFAQYFRSKRKPLADFAQGAGVPAGAALLIRANLQGMDRPDQVAALLERFSRPTQVLDFSRHLRQQMLPKEELVARLRDLLRDGPSTFVVRDFVQGEAGLITHIIGEGAEPHVLVEVSPDGLLAINRGTADTSTVVIGADGVPHTACAVTGPLLGREHLQALHRATLAAAAHFGQVQLEWVISDGSLCLIDFSPISAAAGNAPVGGGRIISAGYANGKSLVVEASRGLEELSIAASVSLTNIPTPEELGPLIQQIFERIQASNAPVIILSPRPYAALASLVPYAAGFIFEQASTLCHLAILLREHGVPALGSRELYRHALGQSHAVVDTSSV